MVMVVRGFLDRGSKEFPEALKIKRFTSTSVGLQHVLRGQEYEVGKISRG